MKAILAGAPQRAEAGNASGAQRVWKARGGASGDALGALQPVAALLGDRLGLMIRASAAAHDATWAPPPWQRSRVSSSPIGHPTKLQLATMRRGRR